MTGKHSRSETASPGAAPTSLDKAMEAKVGSRSLDEDYPSKAELNAVLHDLPIGTSFAFATRTMEELPQIVGTTDPPGCDVAGILGAGVLGAGVLGANQQAATQLYGRDPK